jgi:NADH-quinone oxidoreductase subunit F
MNIHLPLQSIKEFNQLQKKLEEHEKYEKEVKICMGGGCIASGAMEILPHLEEEARKLKLQVVQTGTGCMGPCSRGPILKIGNTEYQAVHKDNLSSILETHFIHHSIDRENVLYSTEFSDEENEALGFNKWMQLQKKLVLQNCGTVVPLSIESAIQHGSYSAFSAVMADKVDILKELKEAGLRGRGGAGFPTWLKWKFTKDAEGDKKYVLCNADEGDPGAFMDRSILEGDPHRLIEGMLIAAKLVGADEGIVYVRAEYPLAVARLEKALEEAEQYGLLGENILGTDFSCKLSIRMGSGAFVCGEETALIASIEGKRGEPRPRPPFPAQKGLWGKPTLLNNVETYANIAALITIGGKAFKDIGSGESGGTKVFALAGAVENTGLVEVPIGTSLGELIFDIGGGIRNGGIFKAAQVGGPSGGCIPKQHLNVPMDYESLKELGAIMGSGGLIVLDETSCMVDVARFFLDFVQEESCGKCVPCRVGTKRMLEILNRICSGEGQEGDIEKLEELGRQIQETSLCGLGQTAPNPVLSTIRHFRQEYEDHIRSGHCEAGVCSGLVRASCQSACPAAVDIPGFVSLTAEGKYAEALKLHRDRNPFAAVCARVCFHTCEDKCRRSSMDSAVSIRGVKRFLVDQEVTIQLPEMQIQEENAAKKIAIIGAGPAGLSCGYFLSRLGYKPDIFEASSRAGGMLVQTIPAYRLPREVVAREIRMIESMGSKIHLEKKLGVDYTLEGLREQGYEAVFLGIGAPDSVSMGLPGEEGLGVVQAVPFLQQYNISGSVEIGKNILVIGGGNAAIDAARTAIRLGAETVKIIYRRSRNEMPAYEEEIDAAVEEGIELLPLVQPLQILLDDQKSVRGMQVREMSLGKFDSSGRRRAIEGSTKPFEIAGDQVILALGQRLDTKRLFGEVKPNLDASGFVAADPKNGQTSFEWLFTGGDCCDGPNSVVAAIGAGEKAAVGIDVLLSGQDHAFWRYEKEGSAEFDPDAEPSEVPRASMELVPVERRKHTFEEAERSWDRSEAHGQAARCLRCDYGKKIRMRTEEQHG